MKKIIYLLITLGLMSTQTGCSTFTSPARMKPIKDSGTYWLNYSSDRRGAIVSTSKNANELSIKVCAEPAPDTNNNFELQGTLKKNAIGEASAQTGQSVIILPGRNPNVLSLREALYRLCELSINRPDISSDELMSAYNKVIFAITQSAQAEAMKSAATTDAVIKAIAPDNPSNSAFSLARNAELDGFEKIANGSYSDALVDFSKAEEIYPGYHNVFEIRNALRKALSDGKMDESEKQSFLHEFVKHWQWGVPKDLLDKINAQTK